jgi:hypothetical protein
MRKKILALTIVAFSLGVAWSAEGDPRSLLQTREILSLRINLNPAGGGLGFETTVDGVDPRVEALVALIRSARPGGGHKCPNTGAIRFRLEGGRVVGIGLLPGHGDGSFGLRVYDGDDLVAVYLVERDDLVRVLEPFGVPADDPSLRE